MPIREFTDSTGLKWRVWSTLPLSPSVYDVSLRAGWLTFESATGRKRLAPIPAGWEDASAEALERLLGSAEVARPTGNTPDPDSSIASAKKGERRPGQG